VADTYDLGTDVGKVRLVIADTDITDPDFSDAEIEAALSMETGIKRAGARLLRSLAANRARLAIRVSRGGVGRTGGQFEDFTKVAYELRALADKLESESAEDDEAGVAASSVIVTPNWRGYTDWGTSDEVR